MIIYRITKEKYAHDLSGRGAERFGGRWNNKGVPVIYASEHRSLCLLEMLVHTPVHVLPRDFVFVEISLPDDCSVYNITLKKLPQTWKAFPYDRFTKQIGDELLNAMKHPVIRVPSALVEGEFNLLVNPLHEVAKVTDIKALELDTRFFDR